MKFNIRNSSCRLYHKPAANLKIGCYVCRLAHKAHTPCRPVMSLAENGKAMWYWGKVKSFQKMPWLWKKIPRRFHFFGICL